MVSFKELCGLTPAANMKQCILTVSSWLMNSERSLKVTVDLSETYPTMEAQGPVPELLRKVLNAYDMVRVTNLVQKTHPIQETFLRFFFFWSVLPHLHLTLALPKRRTVVVISSHLLFSPE